MLPNWTVTFNTGSPALNGSTVSPSTSVYSKRQAVSTQSSTEDEIIPMAPMNDTDVPVLASSIPSVPSQSPVRRIELLVSPVKLLQMLMMV
jgi:hypothetical protein